jgi:hypothetical protein
MKESEKTTKDVYWKIVDPSSDDESEYSDEEPESEAGEEEEITEKKGNEGTVNEEADPAWDVKVQEEDEEAVMIKKRFRGFNK